VPVVSRASLASLKASIDQLMLDVRHCLRVLRNAPAFTAVAVLSLALGIGANTAIFSIVNGVMLKMLPVRDPGRIVSFVLDKSARGKAAEPASFFTNPMWEQIRDHQDALDGVTAYSTQAFDIGTGGEVQRVAGVFVSGRYFDVVGARPWIGRTFTEDDDRRGGGSDGPVAVLGYAFWRDRYNASPAAIGSTMRIEGSTFTIVGVTPPGFFGLEVGKSFDVAIPLGAEPFIRGKENSRLDMRGSSWLNIAGRLKPGETLAQATAGLRAMQPAIRQATLPERTPLAEHFTDPLGVSSASTGVSYLRDDYRPALFMLMAIVGLVLLIACANLANLLLARATARQKEFAVRLAMGASRGRLMRQLLTESMLLASAGALLGFAFAYSASRAIVRTLSSSRTPVFVDVSIDWRVLSFTIAVAGATVVLFGMAPALRATRVSANDVLKAAGRGLATGWTRFNLEKLLVTAQIALSLVLVFGASLFVRSFATLATRDPGFNADRIMQVGTSIARADIPPAQRVLAYDQLASALRAIPGVESAAAVQIPPVRGDMSNTRVQVDGFTPKTARDNQLLSNRVSAGYFQTMSTPFRAGRDFNDRDTLTSPRVVIINEAAQDKFFHGENPVGRTLKLEIARDTFQPLTVIGVVRNTAYQTLRETPPPLMYFPLSQTPQPGTFMTFVLRTTGDTTSLAHAVTTAGRTVNPNITFELRTLEMQIAENLIQERLLAMLSGFFGSLALLVAGIGLYGMMSLAVARRRSELGVRMALGADARRIVSMVLRDVALITTIGLIAGAALAFASARLVSTLLFGLTPTDPASGAISMLLLATVALLAGYLPARRAARVDPMIALRDQ
jgi:putative ABC transport system permease protein